MLVRTQPVTGMILFEKKCHAIWDEVRKIGYVKSDVANDF